MKYIFAFIILSFSILPVFADMIYFNDGRSYSGTVSKITENEIEYSSNNKTDKTARKDVWKIVYDDGRIAVINETKINPEYAENVKSSPESSSVIIKIAPAVSCHPSTINGYEHIKNRDAFILRPQAKVVPGIKFSIDGFSASVYNALPYEHEQVSSGGLSRFFSADARYYTDTIGGELYFQRINQYVVQDRSKIWRRSVKHSRDDITTMTVGGDAFISLIDDDNSLKCGIGQNGLQKKTFAHALVCMLSGNYFMIDGDYPYDPRATYDKQKSILKETKISHFSIAPGYSFSVTVRNFYASAFFCVLGYGASIADYNDLYGMHRQKSWSLYQPFGRFSAGYDGQSLFAGMNMNYRAVKTNMDLDTQFINLRLYSNSIKVEMFYGVKF